MEGVGGEGQEGRGTVEAWLEEDGRQEVQK